jgi:hypothetical protein
MPAFVVLFAVTQQGCSTDSRGEGPVTSVDAAEDVSVVVSDAQPDQTTGAAETSIDAAADAASDATVEADADAEAVADASPDASPDAETDDGAPPEDAACSGVMCNGHCLAASDCRGCTGASLLCGLSGVCVNDCTSCVQGSTSRPVECFSCDSTRQNPVGTCESTDSNQYCLSGSYLGGYLDGSSGFHCSCGGVADAGCPGANQVCAPTPGTAHICVTCGENYVYNLADAACSGGGVCNPSALSCH